MLPAEVRTIIERAATARERLLGLLDVLPHDYWARASAGDTWCIGQHVAHVAAADRLVAELLWTAGHEPELWLGGTTDSARLAARREEGMAGLAGEAPAALLHSMAEARRVVVGALADVDGSSLDTPVFVAGMVNTWGQPVRLTLRRYLAIWAAHDLDHEAAIRDAARQEISPGVLVAGMRPGR